MSALYTAMSLEDIVFVVVFVPFHIGSDAYRSGYLPTQTQIVRVSVCVFACKCVCVFV